MATDGNNPAPPPGRRTAVGLQIQLPCANRAELKAKYGADLARGELFVRTKTPKPVSTLIRFDFRLANGETALRGAATVKAIVEEGEPGAKPGMLLLFLAIDAESHALLREFGTPLTLPVLKPPEPKPGEAGEAPAEPTTSAAPTKPAAPPPPAAPSTATGSNRPVAPAPLQAPLPTPVISAPPPPAAPASPKPEGAVPAGSTAGATEFGLTPPKTPIVRRGPVVGIDLGTTNSCVAWMHHEKPHILPSREGYNTVPSVLAINEKGRLLIGSPAKSQLLTNPRNTVYGAKRLIGRPFNSTVVQQLREKFPYEIVEGPRGEAAVGIGGRVFTLQEVSALILKEVREIARAKLGQDVTRAVITVPAHYNELQRQAVREAGELAGLYVEQILNEPTAAALAFGHGRSVDRAKQRVLVYDLGGGTFDVSVLELHGGNIYEVVSTGGDTFLGGVDFDLKLLEVLLQRYESAHGVAFDGDRVALQRILDAAERAKMALSEASTTNVHVPFVAMIGDKPANLEATITRGEMETATAHLVDRTLVVATEVLAARGLKPTDVDEVLLVGGQSRMPLVRERLRQFFGKEPHKGVHPDEAVALGAAVLANSIASERADSLVLIDVLPMSVGVGLPGGRFKKVIERNTALPHTRSHTIATTRDNQTSVELDVFQGESDRAMENEHLGNVRIDGLPKAPRGAVKVDVTFKLSKESILTVSVAEGSSGQERVVRLATRDTPEQLRSRLADSQPTPAAKTGLWGFFKRLFKGRAA